ncbi:EF-Tu/IF-2/RF-3 family GTPase [Nocardioides ultimimeridianus]
MSWKFWKSDTEQTEAERSLDRLGSGGSAAPSWRPDPSAPTGSGFTMEVEDVFSITGRGTVVTGSIATGTLTVGQTVCFLDARGKERGARVNGIEMFRRIVDTAGEGDAVGLLLDGVAREDVLRGALLRSER